jgi:Ca2+-binding EF-hand superfamily protein
LRSDQEFDDVYFIFRRYDLDNDGKLYFSEFQKLLLPSDGYVAQVIAQRKDSRLSLDAMDLLRRMVRAHINIEHSHEYLRNRVNRVILNNNTSLRGIFEELDHQRKGYFNIFDIENMLELQREKVEAIRDVGLLMHKYDKSQQKRIYFSSFAEQMYPQRIQNFK